MTAISQFKIAATLLDMLFSVIDERRVPCQLSVRKLLYLHFVQMAAIFNFKMTVALPALFSVIEHTNIPVNVSWFLSPISGGSRHFAKWGAFNVVHFGI